MAVRRGEAKGDQGRAGFREPRVSPDGFTKLAVRFKKDLIIPSSEAESPKLVEALNALLNERKEVELRDKEAAEALKQKLQREKSGVIR